MGDTPDNVADELRNRLRKAEENKHEATKQGDELGAAYAMGKQSAFITAIEIVEGHYGDVGHNKEHTNERP